MMEEPYHKPLALPVKTTLLARLHTKKTERNREYVRALLELEGPVITDKMLKFLLQEDVCRTLVQFIAFPSDEEGEPGGNVGANPAAEEPEEEPEEGGSRGASAPAPQQRPRKRQRPGTSGEVTTALRHSYAATMIMAGPEPTGASTELVIRMSSVIFDALFAAFEPDSTASFVHVVHVLEYLAEEDMDAVLEQIMGVDAAAGSGSTKSPHKRGPAMESMDRFLLPLLLNCEHSSVMKFLLRVLNCDGASQRTKWRFYTALGEWKVLVKIATEVCGGAGSGDWSAEEEEQADGGEAAMEHVDACAELFLATVQRLSYDVSGGELLLQPIAHCPELVGGLVAALEGGSELASSSSYGRRYAAARALHGLVRLCAPRRLNVETGAPADDVGGDGGDGGGGVRYGGLLGDGAPVEAVQNQLHSVTAELHAALGGAVPSLVKVLASGERGWQALASTSPSKLVQLPPLDDVANSLAHTGHYRAPPLTAMRVTVISLIADMVEGSEVDFAVQTAVSNNGSSSSDDDDDDEEEKDYQRGGQIGGKVAPLGLCRHLDSLPLELWRCLTSLFLEYPHSDMFHCHFFRLVFAVLRANHTPCLQNLLQRCRFVHHIVDHSSRLVAGETTSAKSVRQLDPLKGQTGHIISFSNAFRLQAALLPPSAFLRSFLQSHQSWRRFLPELEALTVRQQQRGFGFPVPGDAWRQLGGTNTSLKKKNRQKQDLEDDDKDDNFSNDNPLYRGPETFGIVDEDSDDDEENDGEDDGEVNVRRIIDHGSAYAASLGFGADLKPWYDVSSDERRKVRRKRRSKGGAKGGSDSDSSLDSPGSPFEGLGGLEEMHHDPRASLSLPKGLQINLDEGSSGGVAGEEAAGAPAGGEPVVRGGGEEEGEPGDLSSLSSSSPNKSMIPMMHQSTNAASASGGGGGGGKIVNY